MQAGKIYQHFEFIKSSKTIRPVSCFFLFGMENYLKDKVLKMILSKFSTEDTSQFDVVKLYGDDTTAGNVIEQLEMMPFLAKHKIVILKNFDNMKKNDKDSISDYLNDPVETSILIIDSEKNDKRSSAYKNISKKAICVECKPPFGFRDILIWLNNETSLRGIQMDNETANLFASYIQPDYMIAANELEKLIILSKNRKVITAEEVTVAVGRSRTNNIFDLQNALGVKDLKKSLTILENLIDNNESPIFVISMLTNFFKNIWKILVLRKNNIKDSEISTAYLKDIFHSFREKQLNYARNFDLTGIRNIFSLLLETDIALKSIDVKESILLETLIFNICKH